MKKKPNEQGDRHCITRRGLVRAGLGIAGFAACAGFVSHLRSAYATDAAPRSAFNVIRVDFDDLDAQEIYLDAYAFDLSRAKEVVTTGVFRYREICTYEQGRMTYGVYYDIVPDASLVDLDIDGEFSCLLENVGRDVDGAPLDARLRLHDVRLERCDLLTPGDSSALRLYGMVTLPYVTHAPEGEGLLSLQAGACRPFDAGEYRGAVYQALFQKMLDVDLIRHDTGERARGTYLFAVRDIDQMYESCQFASGFGTDLYVSLDTLVDVDASTGWCYSTATDNDTERSQVIGVATSPFSIVWRGRDCGTQLFQGPSQTIGVAGVEKVPGHRSWLSRIKKS